MQAGQPAQKGNKRGPAYSSNVKEFRDRKMKAARQAEKAYERFVAQWQPRPPKGKVHERLNPTRLE
ncbi:hypothetical protein [Microvirga sp. P5_D2]